MKHKLLQKNCHLVGEEAVQSSFSFGSQLLQQPVYIKKNPQNFIESFG